MKFENNYLMASDFLANVWYKIKQICVIFTHFKLSAYQFQKTKHNNILRTDINYFNEWIYYTLHLINSLFYLK